jgi:hypothetical protein
MGKHDISIPLGTITFIDTASKEELDELSTLVSMAKKRWGKWRVKTLTVGDTVQWSSGRTRGRYANMTMRGNVVKINTTRVKVDTGSGVWNVPGTMLEIV